MRLETWNENDMRDLVRELYEKKGYQVENTHGRFECGIDLLAKKLDSAGRKIIEKIGIQVTISKAGKSRVKDATMALTRKGSNLTYFLIIAINGYKEDFDVHLKQFKLEDEVIKMNGDDLEKELFTYGILPERELKRFEGEFYGSKSYAILNDITSSIYVKGYLPKLKLEPAFESVRINKTTIMRNLRLLMRGLQEISSSSRSVHLSMLGANSKQRFELFIDLFLKGQGSILKPLRKARIAIRNLESIPAAMKLFFGSLSGTECALFIEKGRKVVKDFWIFAYFDSESIYKYGYSAVLLQIFCGLYERANEIKYRVERALEILEGGDKEIRENLDYFISSFPIQTKS